MTVRVIVLNGGSSSGKSGIARCLQAVLPGTWPPFGAGTLVEAVPASLRQAETGGIGFGADGQVSVGDEFRALDVAWSRGVAEMARAGDRRTGDRRAGVNGRSRSPNGVELGSTTRGGAAR